MTGKARNHHWLVRTHYRMRAISFAMLFVASSLQIAEQNYPTVAWLLLALLLLLYPHLQWWRARRSTDAVQTEMHSLLLDSVLLGAFAAGLGFPLWIAFSAIIGTLSNNAANKGWRGIIETLLAFPGGALLWVQFAGFSFSPETNWPATLFCMFGLMLYLSLIGNLGYARQLQLRKIREKLQVRAKELLAANESLRNKLQEIDGLHQQLHEQANRDPLTKLYNRHYLDCSLNRELALCKGKGRALSLIMIDIDHFKKINDRYGHQAGDEMLVRLSAILGLLARSGDVACRYVGEKFVVLLPGMPLATALGRAEQLCQAFADLCIPFEDIHLQSTVSIGVASYPEHGDVADILLRQADHALYQAKENGRNQFVTLVAQH